MAGAEEFLYEITTDDLNKVDAFSVEKHTAVLVIFFSDIVGSTGLTETMTKRQGEIGFQTLRDKHDALLTSIISRDNAGRVIKSTGDGLLAVFREPSAAVERALEIQEALQDDPVLQRISVRIGLDMGQVRVESAGGVQQDMFGRHVNWAARAESLADGGHIIVTRPVYTDAAGWFETQIRKRARWKEHGFYVVKEDEESLEVFEPYNANITIPMDELRGTKIRQPPKTYKTKKSGVEKASVNAAMFQSLSVDRRIESVINTVMPVMSDLGFTGGSEAEEKYGHEAVRFMLKRGADTYYLKAEDGVLTYVALRFHTETDKIPYFFISDTFGSQRDYNLNFNHGLKQLKAIHEHHIECAFYPISFIDICHKMPSFSVVPGQKSLVIDSKISVPVLDPKRVGEVYIDSKGIKSIWHHLTLSYGKFTDGFCVRNVPAGMSSISSTKEGFRFVYKDLDTRTVNRRVEYHIIDDIDSETTFADHLIAVVENPT